MPDTKVIIWMELWISVMMNYFKKSKDFKDLKDYFIMNIYK